MEVSEARTLQQKKLPASCLWATPSTGTKKRNTLLRCAKKVLVHVKGHGRLGRCGRKTLRGIQPTQIQGRVAGLRDRAIPSCDCAA